MNKQKVTLTRDTLIQGEWHEKGSSLEVQDFQKRFLVEAGYVEGRVPEDIASPGEVEQGALNVLKKASERDDIDPWSIERAHQEGWGYGEAPKDTSKKKS